MPGPASTLFPLLRSRLMTDIVTELYLQETAETVTGLARKLGVDHKNISSTVSTLVQAGIVSAEQVGRSRLLTANKDAPFYGPLLQLLTIVQGPPVVIKEALHDCPGVVGAYIFGSWAARATGVAGEPPRDVDVLILSDTTLDRGQRRVVFDALDQASTALRRSTNPVFATVDQWRNSGDAFLTDVREGPLVPVVLLPDEG